MTGPQSARPKKTAAMSDPSRRTRFEGRQGDKVAHSRLNRLRFVTQDPERTSGLPTSVQKSPAASGAFKLIRSVVMSNAGLPE
jgi:hypothetical protein